MYLCYHLRYFNIVCCTQIAIFACTSVQVQSGGRLTEIVLSRARFSDSPYERRFANNKLVLSVSRAEPSHVSPPTHSLI